MAQAICIAIWLIFFSNPCSKGDAAEKGLEYFLYRDILGRFGGTILLFFRKNSIVFYAADTLHPQGISRIFLYFVVQLLRHEISEDKWINPVSTADWLPYIAKYP